MLLIIIACLYGIFLAAWAVASLIIVFHMLKYTPISLTGWILIVAYFLVASSILGWTWNGIMPLVDFNEFSFPAFSPPQSF